MELANGTAPHFAYESVQLYNKRSKVLLAHEDFLQTGQYLITLAKHSGHSSLGFLGCKEQFLQHHAMRLKTRGQLVEIAQELQKLEILLILAIF